MTTSTDTPRRGRLIKQDSAARQAVDQSNDVVRRVLQALMRFYDLSPEQVARALGMSKATAYRRINGESVLTAGEVFVMAQVFGVTTDEIYSGTATYYPDRVISVPDQDSASTLYSFDATGDVVLELPLVNAPTPIPLRRNVVRPDAA